MNKGLGNAISPKGARTSRSQSASPSAALKAMQLLGRWTRVAQGHLAYGMSCSCCTDLGSVEVQDMEQHVLDYLDGKYRSAGVQSVCVLLSERAGYRPGEAGNIADLLRAIATQVDGPIKSEDQLALLADLERSIDSLDELMRGV
ncbi:MAG: hypothetical protein V1796_06215 [Pseudomonadota bacterium]